MRSFALTGQSWRICCADFLKKFLTSSFKRMGFFPKGVRGASNHPRNGGKKFETTHEVAAKERHRKKPSKKDGEKRREEKLRGRKRVVSENKAATAQKGKALRHGKGFRGR